MRQSNANLNHAHNSIHSRQFRNGSTNTSTNQSQQSQNPGAGSNRLYVGNLPWNTEESDLREHFQMVGPVTRVRMIFDRETDEFKGFAFVDMLNVSDAQNAIHTLHGIEFGGRALKVSEAKPDKRFASQR